MTLHKILKILALILGIAGVIFLGIIISKGDEAVASTGEGIDGFFYVAYATMFITVVSVLIFVFKDVFSGNVKRTLISVGAFAAIVLISYVLADGTPMQLREGDSLSASGSKWVDTGLFTFYIMAIIAIGTMLFTSAKRLMR